MEVWVGDLAKDPRTLYLSTPGSSGTAEFRVQCSEMGDY